MRFQLNPSWCGPAALSNALQSLQGFSLPQAYIAQLSGTTCRAGTDEVGIKRALDYLEIEHKELASCEVHYSTRKLWYHVVEGGSAILCFDEWEHWVVCIGVTGGKFVIYDSDTEKGGCLVLTTAQLLERWIGPEEPLYYAILLNS